MSASPPAVGCFVYYRVPAAEVPQLLADLGQWQRQHGQAVHCSAWLRDDGHTIMEIYEGGSAVALEAAEHFVARGLQSQGWDLQRTVERFAQVATEAPTA